MRFGLGNPRAKGKLDVPSSYDTVSTAKLCGSSHKTPARFLGLRLKAEAIAGLHRHGLAVGIQRHLGKAPTVRRGRYKGDQLSVDHITPRAVCPELDNVIANLELMPLRMNEGKRDKVGARQTALAQKLAEAGLLSRQGLKVVERAQR